MKKRLINFLRSKKIDILLILILFLLVGYVYRGWFSPGIIAKGDLRSWSKIALKEFVSPPSAWLTLEGGGYYSLRRGLQIIRHPFLSLQGLTAQVFNADFSLVERLTLFYPFLFLSVSGMYFLVDYLFKNKVVNFFATLAFLINPLTVAWAYVSHSATMLFAYSFCPFIFLFFLKAFQAQAFKKSLQYSLLTSMLFSLIFYHDIRIACLIFGAMAGFVFYSFVSDLHNKDINTRKDLFQGASVLIIIFLTTICLNLFWLISFIMLPPVKGIVEAHYFAADVVERTFSFLYALIPCALEFNMDTIFLLIMGACAFSFLLFYERISKKKKRMLIFFLAWFLVAAFLRKEGSPPFGGIFIWMFKNIPGFSAFRSGDKILFVAILPWSIMFGFSVFSLSKVIFEELPKELSQDMPFGISQNLVWGKRKQRIAKGTMFFIFTLLLFANLSWLLKDYPLADSANNNNIKYLSTLKPEPISKENLEMEEFFSKDSDKFRILYLPTDPAYGILNKKHTAVYPSDINPAGLALFDYFLSWRWEVQGPFFRDEMSNLGSVLSLKNVKYIVCLPQSDIYYQTIGTKEERREATKLLVLLQKQRDFKRINLDKEINIFVNQGFEPNKSIFLTTNSFLINGDYDSLPALSKAGIDFNNSVLFSVYHLRDRALDSNIEFKKIINFKKDKQDLILSSLSEDYFIDLWPLGQEITPDSYWDKNKRGFWKEYNKYPTLANSQGEIPLSPNGLIKGRYGSFNIPINITEPGLYEIWLRLALVDNEDVNEDISVDEINELFAFKINNQIIAHEEISLKYSKNLEWIRLFNYDFFNKENGLTINYLGKDRALVLDVLAVVPIEKIEAHKKVIEDFLEDKILITIQPDELGKIIKPGENREKISFNAKEIKTTDYEINFETTKPGFLVFRDNYDSYWKLKLNGKELKSIKTFGENNSFYISEPGSYTGTLSFTPQQYMDIGFVSTIISWFILIITEIYLFWSFKKAC